jgi:acyl-CoA reductase-like NAD-dependent aldehyde dehydrogenase
MVKKRFVVMIVALCLITGFAAGVWAERQPHMRAALEHLRSAKDELKAAARDKGGHRIAALKAIDEAIDHVKEGMRYADTH